MPNAKLDETPGRVGLHEAAQSMGHASGTARAKALSHQERKRIAKLGGEARGRQEGQTSDKGQVTRKAADLEQVGHLPTVLSVQKAAGPWPGQPDNEQPPKVAQEVTPVAGPEDDVEYGSEVPDHVRSIARHLNTPRPPKTEMVHDPSLGQAVQRYFDTATAALGRGSGRNTPSIGNSPTH